MKNNLVIKNYISGEFYKLKNHKKNIKINKKFLSNCVKEIDNKKNIFSLFSKDYNFNFSSLKKFKKFKSIIIIGMGGSILGSKAIFSFLKQKIKKEIIFIDNLDSLQFRDLQKKKIIKQSLFIIISKSGNTLETLVNTNLLKNKISNKNTIVITEKKKSKLLKFCKEKKIFHINHKEHIGGRYSVLSEVGMLPAYLMGLNLKDFRKNSLKYLKNNKEFLYTSSSIIAQNYLSKKINSIIFFNYCSQLNDFIYWCQQLLAESLGKKGKGILPVLSPAPKDHHSLLQLYLDGPKDKIFYIVSAKSGLNRKIEKIVSAQKNAFIKVLKKKRIPFRIIHVSNCDEVVIGELFTYFMLETIFVANLIKVNAFDQPAVEQVKIQTKKNLQ